MSALALHGGTPAVRAAHPPRWPYLSDKARARVERLLEADCLYEYGSGGPPAELEAVIADYHRVPHVLSLSSGTAALHAAYFGAGIGPGDEVLVPTYTFHATVAPLLLLGAVPVLVDCEPETGTLDPDDARRRVGARTRAVVVNHLWGHPADMDAIAALASEHGLVVVEDAAHAHGARHRGRLAGTLGHVAAFSLGASKMVSGGHGGALLTGDRRIYERALLLGHCHERAEVELGDVGRAAVGFGENYRITPLAAAICIEQFLDLDQRIAVKTAVLEGLSRRLDGIPGLRPQLTRPCVSRGGWYGYKARYLPEELDGLPLDGFIRALQAEGLQVDRPSSQPLHWAPMFQRRDLEPEYYRPGGPRPLYRRGDLPGGEAYYQASLSFPATRLHEPCDDLLDQYAEGIRKVVAQHERLLDPHEAA